VTSAIARIDPGGPGTATFKWTPNASDVGIHALDLIASDGQASTRQTVSVDVKSAVSSAGSPIFRQPLGSGTTLDLAAGKLRGADRDRATATARRHDWPRGALIEEPR
jgi:hypothetical protein